MGLLLLIRFYRCYALRSCSRLFSLRRFCRDHPFRSCGLYGLLLLILFYRCYALRSCSRLFSLRRFCRDHPFRSCGLCGFFLLIRFYRCYALRSCSRLFVLVTRSWLVRLLVLARHKRLFRLRRFCRDHLLWCGLNGLPTGFDLPLLKFYFRFRLVHFFGRYDMVCAFGRFDTGFAVDLSFLNLLNLFPDHNSVFFPALLNNGCVFLDSVDHRIVGLLLYRCVCEVVPLFVCCVIVDHGIIDNRRRLIVVDNRGGFYIGHPDILVIVHTVEIVPGDDDGMPCVGMASDIDIDPGDIDVGDDHLMGASPVAVAVVCLAWRQRHPSHIGVMVNPGNPSGRPEETDVQKGKAHTHVSPPAAPSTRNSACRSSCRNGE